MERANTAPIGKPDWILLLVMAAFMLVTMFYADMVIIYNHSLTFLDSFFGMDMANFYANTLEKPYMGFGAVYYWQVYAVIGIWNLPIWILSKIFHINVFSVKCLLWCRLEVVFFLILTLYMLEKIMKDFGFGKEKYRFVQFMFASSLMVILPTIAISQIDIITVFLMLWGIREYLNTDKITWKFLLIFSFAKMHENICAVCIHSAGFTAGETNPFCTMGFICGNMVHSAWQTAVHGKRRL